MNAVRNSMYATLKELAALQAKLALALQQEERGLITPSELNTQYMTIMCANETETRRAYKVIGDNA